MNSSRKSTSGQAFVEFVILLFLIMILCSGMLYASRMLTFDFWAGQEARILAFERTWVSEAGGTDGINYVESNRDEMRSPSSVQRIQPTHSSTTEGNLSDLISLFAFNRTPERAITPRPQENSSAPVLLARGNPNSLWFSKTSDWFRTDTPEVVSSAFAHQDTHEGSFRNRRVLPSDRPPKPSLPIPVNDYRADLAKTFTKVFHKGRFGERFCKAMEVHLRKNNIPHESSFFARDECPPLMTRGFATHVANELDVPMLWQEFGEQIEWFGPDRVGEALEITVKKTLATHFYSFFDTAVAVAFQGAGIAITANLFSTFNDLVLDNPNRLGELGTLVFPDPTEARYWGSQIAMDIVAVFAFGVVGQSFVGGGREAERQTEFDFQMDMDDWLHADARDPLNLSSYGALGNFGSQFTNGFNLGFMYLPIPPLLNYVTGGLYDGAMKLVLDRNPADFCVGFGDYGCGGDLWTSMIEQSVKVGEVTYDADAGLFPAARSRWDTSERALTRRFMLLTEPWHIMRREDGTGNWRNVGDDNSSISSSDYEGVLRRRGVGFYILPSRFTPIVEPLMDLVPDFPGLDGIISAVQSAENIVSDIKSFVLNNPLTDLVNFLNEIPGLNIVDFGLPYFPPVHPMAYPGSTEEMNNRLADNEERQFADFLEEQMENLTPARPEYHED